MSTAVIHSQTVVARHASPHYAKVMFTTDFSATSLEALPLAAAVARTFSSDLHLLYAMTPGGSGTVVPEFGVDVSEVMAGDAFARLVGIKHSDELQGVRVATPEVFRRGLWELPEKIARDEFDLLVMATHGNKGFRHLLLGSVTEELIRTAPCPVLTVSPHVKLKAGAEFHPKHILFATDATADSFRALPHAMLFAQRAGCDLTLVHVLAKGSEMSPQARAFAALMQDALHEALPLTAIKECSPEIVVCFGDPVEEILNAARERESELIVMGARSNANKATFSHSVSYGVIADAKCPVLTVKGRS